VGIAYLGETKVGSRDTVEIEFTMPTGVKRQFYFDLSSHLLLKESGATGGRYAEEILYDDYRPENAISIAHKTRTAPRRNEIYNIVVNQISVNQSIGERVFDFPIKSQVRLPDLKQLFKEIDANQKVGGQNKGELHGSALQRKKRNMTAPGKSRKWSARSTPFFYLNGEEISTLVGEDGKPLSAEKQAKQNDITKKRIEEIQRKQSKKEEKEEKAREEGKDEKGQ